MTRGRSALGLLAVVCVAACGGGGSDPSPDAALASTTIGDSFPTVGEATAPATTDDEGVMTITLRLDDELGEISPLIRGFSGVPDEYLRDVGGTVNSWGGNPSTRFNYEIGHAWNAAHDWEYRNTNYGNTGDDALAFVMTTAAAGASVRLAVPTLGWIAKNDDDSVCSFPSADGGCVGDGGASCQEPGPIADPNVANVESTPEMVQRWVERLVASDPNTIAFIAMDNEPELWGHTHYDVHPSCPTFEEILDKYLTYAEAVRQAAPNAALLGPVNCCWFEYWRNAPGPAEGGDEDYLTWFLRNLREHDEDAGHRTVHVLDVHYYPQSDVYNDNTDPDTSARRLRSTRSLWDSSYTDESWLNDKIRFVPRMNEIIDAAYPGTKLGITEWNFGADGSMNGALAIADVLGIFGRDGVYLANYWRNPEAGSPGYFAFKMHGNYDSEGSSFAGTAIAIDGADLAKLATYAAVDPVTGHLKVMLINKLPDEDVPLRLDLRGWNAASGTAYRYSEAQPASIVSEPITSSGSTVDVTVPAYSITVLDFIPA